MRHGCLLLRRVHAVALFDQRVELLQDVGAVLITLRVPLRDKRQLPVPGVVPADEQGGEDGDTSMGLITTIS